MPLILTDEQKSFVGAIRDFCARECGTREQRDKLTEEGRHPHNQDIYKSMAELGWLGVAIPEEYGGSGGGLVDLCLFLEETARGQAPIGGFGVSMIVAGAYERFGTDEQKQDDPRRHHQRLGRGDRDVGAGGRLGRRRPAVPRRPRERPLRRQRPEDVDLRGPQGRPRPTRLPDRLQTARSTTASRCSTSRPTPTASTSG